MYFWGQLDLPRGEKIRRKQKPFKFAPRSEDGKEDGHVVPAGYELKVAGDVGVCDPGFVLVGQALTLEIFPRNTNFSSASCMVMTYFCCIIHNQRSQLKYSRKRLSQRFTVLSLEHPLLVRSEWSLPCEILQDT